MNLINEKYDQFKIEKLKHFLEDMSNKGIAKPYEIFVDNLKAVPKTEDVKEFENYEHYINENTQKIRIVIYGSPRSPRNDQYCYYMQQMQENKPNNGLGEVENLIQEKLAARDREYEMKELRAELNKVEEKLEEAEEYVETLEQQIEDMKRNKFKVGNLNLGELASVMTESFLRRNPQIIAKLPGGEALAGILMEDTAQLEKKPANTPVAEGEASFQKKTVGTENLTEEQKRYAAFLAQLEQVFDEKQLADVMLMLQKLAAEPAQLEPIKKLLNI